MTITCRTVPSPVGPLTIAGDSATGTVKYLRMGDQTYPPAGMVDWVDDPTAFEEVVEQIDAYFSGSLTIFDVRIEVEGTVFQRDVWQALLSIPYGETRTYGELAKQIGRPGAARAVGLANGHNPVSIIVPCHRVIGASGNLVGYGGGLDRKKSLLDLEQEHARPRLDFDA